MFVQWLIFLHILASVTFFLAHGASVAMAFKLRSETDLERIKALLDLSASTIGVLFLSFLAMGISGLVLPFFFNFWKTGWVWLSIVLTLFVFIWMVLINDKTYKKLRRLVGLPYMVMNKHFPAEPPASHEEIMAHIQSISVTQLMVIGYGVPTVILWLMTFKPF
ncbi:MAG: hypothetical protein Kow002_05990 [Anaerolineales bacterium]